MAKCKKCEKQFHACSSCYLTHNWEYDYCSEVCWITSDEYSVQFNRIWNLAEAMGWTVGEAIEYIRGFDEEVLWNMKCYLDKGKK